MKVGISILPGNCQAYRDGYRYGAYEERGGEEHIVEFFKTPDEIQVYVNSHPEYWIEDDEIRETLLRVARDEREKIIGNSLYRVSANAETRNWFVIEIYNDGKSYGLARGFHSKNLMVVLESLKQIDRERYFLDRGRA